MPLDDCTLLSLSLRFDPPGEGGRLGSSRFVFIAGYELALATTMERFFETRLRETTREGGEANI